MPLNVYKNVDRAEHFLEREHSKRELFYEFPCVTSAYWICKHVCFALGLCALLFSPGWKNATNQVPFIPTIDPPCTPPKIWLWERWRESHSRHSVALICIKPVWMCVFLDSSAPCRDRDAVEFVAWLAAHRKPHWCWLLRRVASL